MTRQELQELLKATKLTNQKLSRIFKRKPAQISMAIHTEKYPTLRNKIIEHAKKRLKNSAA